MSTQSKNHMIAAKRYLITVLLGCASLTACKQSAETIAPPPPRPTVHAPLPELPLSKNILVQTAAEYTIAHQAAQRVATRKLSNASMAEQSIRDSVALTPSRTSRGYLAYLSLLASQDATFVAHVRETAKSLGPGPVSRSIMGDPKTVYRFNNANAVMRNLAGVMAHQDATYQRIGHQLKTDAYGIQKQKWALKRTQTGRTAALKRISHSTPRAGTSISSILAEAGTPPANFTAAQAHANYTRLTSRIGLPSNKYTQTTPTERQKAFIERAMALAALNSLNVAPDPSALHWPRLDNCLDLSRLQLFQCFSAVRFRYEEPFCLGEHAFKDVGQCLGGR